LRTLLDQLRLRFLRQLQQRFLLEDSLLTVPEALSQEGLDILLADLGSRAGRTAVGFRRGMFLVSALFFVMAPVYGIKFNQWGIAAFIAAFGVGMMVIGVTAARRTSPERMLHVLSALRNSPGQISLVRHYETSDSHRMFVSHWIEVKTDKHRLVVKADRDWQELLDFLSRRCPQAQRRES